MAGELLTTALMTSLAVRSFFVVFLAFVAVTDGTSALLVVSTIGVAFLIKVFGVCGVSKSLNFRNFLCGGVLPVRLVDNVLVSVLS